MSVSTLLQQETSKVHKAVLEANARYAADFGDKAKLPLPPGRKFAVLTRQSTRGCRKGMPMSSETPGAGQAMMPSVL